MPKISVVIPIFGVSKYIEKCAVSLFEQTLEDIEFIFVNDCTKDNSIEILMSVIDRYPNRKAQIRIINHEINKGLPIARKRGIDSAVGEYIYHCDSDDWLDVNMLQTMYEAAKNNNADIVYCDFYFAWEDKTIVHREKESKDYCSDILRDRVSPNVWNKLCKMSLYADRRVIFPKGNMGEDFALMCQLSTFASQVVHVPKPLYYYRQNQASLTGTKDKESIKTKFNNLEMNYNTIIKFADSVNNDKFKNIIIDRIVRMKSILYPYICDKDMYNLWKDSFRQFHFKWLLSLNVGIKEKMKYIYHYYFLK